MNVLSLIPARGGSKGIYRKNIRMMTGYPLIYYTIRCSLSCKMVNRTVVSTDDEEIARIAMRFGAEVPFLRPRELAEDATPDYPVALHCVDYMRHQKKWEPDLLVYLRPTLPLRTSGEIDEAVTILSERPDLDSVRTTRPVPYPPFWMKRRDREGCIMPLYAEAARYQFTRHQDLPEVVMCDGYADVIKVSSLLKHGKLFAGKIYALHRDTGFFLDIDKPEDWELCELLLTKGLGESKG